jgi:adenine phosphoribosyltransferase
MTSLLLTNLNLFVFKKRIYFFKTRKEMDLKSYIRDIPDFPIKGIIFKDITTLLQDADAFHYVIEKFSTYAKNKEIQKIVGIESRGFMFGAALAQALHLPFIPIRKKGKLPWKTFQQEYQLEYGTDIIEIHQDALKKGEKVLLIDDLLATGGTARAASDLIEKTEAILSGIAFLIELDFLKGRNHLANYEVFSLIHYQGE